MPPTGSAQNAAPLVLERGPHHRVVEWLSWSADASGKPYALTNRYTELATGLHYWRDGEWLDSQELVETAAEGAIGAHGQHSVTFASNANTAGAVDVVMPDGRHLRCHVLGLRYWDAQANVSVWLATLTEAEGELHRPNRVLYPGALRGQVTADLGYTWTKAAVEQEVILRTLLPDPERWGLNRDAVWLQAVTEFIEAPDPTAVTAGSGTDREAVSLNFGSMQMPPGWAFTLGATGQRSRAHVSKQWVTVEGRRLLLESVKWGAIDREWRQVTAAVTPEGRETEEQRAVASAVSALPAVSTAQAGRRRGPLQFARNDLPTRPGFVLDWTLVNGTQSGYTFKGDTTYFIAGYVYLSGANNTLEGGAVLKFTNTVSAGINAPTLQCLTRQYSPAVFTSKDDNSVGETIPGSTGSPSGYYANVALSTGSNVQHVRVAYARTGILFSGAGPQTLKHAQFVNCQDALYPIANEVLARNLLVHGVNNVVYADDPSVVRGEHWTVHNAMNLTCDYADLYLTNCLLVAVTNTNPNREHCTLCPRPSATGLFQAVWAGSHYLADDTYRGVGTASINAELRADFGAMTTVAPTLVENQTLTGTDVCWTRHIDRDIPQPDLGAHQPDLGYHYPALDYAVTHVQVNNISLHIAPGTAVAMAGAGIQLLSGAQLINVGSPLALNYLTRYQAVQEQSIISGTGSSGLLYVNSNPAVLPKAELGFTAVSLVADSSSRRALFENQTYYQLEQLRLTDCQLRGTTLCLSLYPLGSDYRVMTVALTNNLAERFDFSLDQDSDYPRLVVQMWNNLFRNGTFHVADYIPTGAFAVRDNLFDAVTMAYCESVPNSHNGYISTTHLPASSGGDKDITAPADYQAGPLGAYYYPYHYPTNGTKLATLIDAGSRTAAAADLWFYTTQSNEVQDIGTVDIGRHYAPTCARLVAEGRPDRIVLFWDVPAWVESSLAILGFNIYRATSAAGPYTQISQWDPSYVADRVYIDSSIDLGYTYYYKVTYEYPVYIPCDWSFTYTESPFSNVASAGTCSALSAATDMLFIFDNTSSFTDPSPGILPTIRNGILAALDEVVAASGTPPDYRLALLTPDNDQVHVRLNLGTNNRTSFVAALNNLPDLNQPWGNRYPESTDECLLTAVLARLANQVVGPTNCTRPDEDPETLQIGDFSAALSKTRKVVVLVTDAPPGGFCDPEDFTADPAYAMHAISIASAASAAGIKVNSIHIPRADTNTVYQWQAKPLMQQYGTITCGWYRMPQVAQDAVKETVLRAVYTAGACSNP
jgi:hypothetical protein